MDKKLLVKKRIVAGARLLDRLASDGFDVSVALWIKAFDKENWHLYLASGVVDEKGAIKAYQLLMNSLSKVSGASPSFSEIKLIGATNPAAIEAKKVLVRHGQHGDRLVLGVHGYHFGDIVAKNSYIYTGRKLVGPRLADGANSEILDALVANLMRGPGPTSPADVELKDGTTFRGILTGLHLESGGKALAQFIEAGESKPRLIDVNIIATVDFPSSKFVPGLPRPDLSFLAEG